MRSGIINFQPRGCRVDPAPDAQRAEESAASLLNSCECVFFRFLSKLYPPGESSTECGACVRPGFCSTVWVLPRRPALDARRAMESVALVLHSYKCVWLALAEALPPRSTVY